ncbi:methyltransferase [Methylomonas sp. HYX-M1]|uniref:methyltransferase n=1 Tax=Methylomonas sp. HYX-M1 TaxID=3139307 RepID=UPI00345C2CBC
MSIFYSPYGRFELRRLPYRKHDQLRAWDAADEYLLEFLTGDKLNQDSSIVLLNDSFGALSLALHAYSPIAISDSYLSQQATLQNCRMNGIDVEAVNLLDSLSRPSKAIDYLLVKVPKNLALLEYQLHRLRPFLQSNSQVIVAGMVKNLPAGVWKLLEGLLGPTRTSLAVKKARLIFADPDPNLVPPINPYPLAYRLEHSDWVISNHANVFSRDSLDIGTRFLLQHLPDNPEYRQLIDLGCGNGIVGMKLALLLPNATVTFVDESFMAVASARENFARAFPARHAEFKVNDALSGFIGETADCIICNPPFHQQHAIGDQIAWQMFRQAHQVLRRGGELRVIGNRHLQYHHSLKKLFGNWEQVAANPKFVIVKAFKR